MLWQYFASHANKAHLNLREREREREKARERKRERESERASERERERARERARDRKRERVRERQSETEKERERERERARESERETDRERAREKQTERERALVPANTCACLNLHFINIRDISFDWFLVLATHSVVHHSLYFKTAGQKWNWFRRVWGSAQLFISIYPICVPGAQNQFLGDICSNSQQYTVWVKIIHISLMPKIIRILRSCSMKIFGKCITVNISKLNFWLVICIAKNFIWTTLKMIFSIFSLFCTLTNPTSMESLFIQLSDDV